MNNEMMQRALKLMADPEFIKRLGESYAAQVLEDKRRRAAFKDSETFQKMLNALTSSAEHRSVSNEEVSYFPDRVKARLGWEFASSEDMTQFFDLMEHPEADSVSQDDRHGDDDCHFDNTSFEHFGLHVSMMFGQGTSILISNKPQEKS